jgi:hypothetical protein
MHISSSNHGTKIDKLKMLQKNSMLAEHLSLWRTTLGKVLSMKHSTMWTGGLNQVLFLSGKETIIYARRWY